MDFFETIKTRYSYRGKFKNADIPKQHMDMIFEAACHSQSGLNQQTSEIIAVTDIETSKKLSAIYDNHEGMLTAPLNVVMISSKKEAHGLTFEMQDYSIMTDNICLAATALGYATVWTDGYTSQANRAEKVQELLNLPDGWTVRAVLPVGIAEEPGTQKEKKGIDEMVHYNKF